MMALITTFDRFLYRYIVQKGQLHGLQKCARLLSASGNGPVYLYLAVAFLIMDNRGEQLFNTMVAAYLLELPLYFALKNMIRRPRPCHALADGVASFEPADKFSLPSGHTAAAFVMATSIYLVYPSLFYITIFWALAIGLARVVLGVHYPLDILAGAMLGIISVLLSRQFI
ncbi:phosphatase PAP2 family protein [Shewanella sp. 125m-7]